MAVIILYLSPVATTVRIAPSLSLCLCLSPSLGLLLSRFQWPAVYLAFCLHAHLLGKPKLPEGKTKKQQQKN